MNVVEGRNREEHGAREPKRMSPLHGMKERKGKMGIRDGEDRKKGNLSMESRASNHFRLHPDSRKIIHVLCGACGGGGVRGDFGGGVGGDTVLRV